MPNISWFRQGQTELNTVIMFTLTGDAAGYAAGTCNTCVCFVLFACICFSVFYFFTFVYLFEPLDNACLENLLASILKLLWLLFCFKYSVCAMCCVCELCAMCVCVGWRKVSW